ncbi:alpha/beta fold hydrolase [Pseudogracilibacillus sp. SO30301A]|uniref:alpha/beta fold hydrolase n=1 Tax=Pseudogracilibacillus sp. SO30301A TaxID=3098291 RepID=UPI00300E67BE
MGKFITTNKGRSFKVHDVPGDQGTITAAHGLTGNHKQLTYFQNMLSGGYRFISYDIRGRGDSDPANEKTSIFTHADDLVDLIDTLDIRRPILMGYSMGAYICALVARRLPEIQALILLDGAGEADDTSRQLVLPSLKRLTKVYPSQEAYLDEVKSLYKNLNVQWKDTLENTVKYDIKQTENGWKHKSNPQLIEQDFESFYNFDPEIIGPDITCKTMLLIATGKIAGKSPLFQKSGYRKTQESINNLVTKYTSVNHYELVFNKQPKIVREIEEFLTT